MKRKVLCLLLVLVLCISIAVPAMAASVPTWKTNVSIPHHFATQSIVYDENGNSINLLFIHTDADGIARVTLKRDLKYGEAGGTYAYEIEVTDEGDIIPLAEATEDVEFDPDTMTSKKGGIIYLEPGLYYFDADNVTDCFYVNVSHVDDLGENPFTDVSISDYYYAPVLWAVQEGITNGTSATQFSPDMTCTQGHILTFLWRAAGEPAPTIDNPFTVKTVTEEMYYYNALLWAYERGIVENEGLDPEAPCSRGDVALYLWRFAGSPDMGPSGFSDVPSSSVYSDAVAWAVENNVTTGTSDTSYSPDAICTRGQIVTFLCRAFIS